MCITRYGGLGLGYEAHVAVMEELSRASGSVALSYGAHSNLCINQIARHATPEQAERFLPELLAGTKVGALSMSEAGSGSDVVSMRTRADRTAGGFILNGTKVRWFHPTVLCHCTQPSLRHPELSVSFTTDSPRRSNVRV